MRRGKRESDNDSRAGKEFGESLQFLQDFEFGIFQNYELDQKLFQETLTPIRSEGGRESTPWTTDIRHKIEEESQCYQ